MIPLIPLIGQAKSYLIIWSSWLYSLSIPLREQKYDKYHWHASISHFPFSIFNFPSCCIHPANSILVYSWIQKELKVNLLRYFLYIPSHFQLHCSLTLTWRSQPWTPAHSWIHNFHDQICSFSKIYYGISVESEILLLLSSMTLHMTIGTSSTDWMRGMIPKATTLILPSLWAGIFLLSNFLPYFIAEWYSRMSNKLAQLSGRKQMS